MREQRYRIVAAELRGGASDTQVLARLRASPLLLLIVLDYHVREARAAVVTFSTAELAAFVPELSRRTVQRAALDLCRAGLMRADASRLARDA